MAEAVPYRADNAKTINSGLNLPGSKKTIVVKNRHWSWYLYASLTVLLIGLGTWGASLLSWRMEQMHITQACLTYTPPAHQVVFEEDPAKLDQFAASNPGCQHTVGGRLCWVPQCWRTEMPNLNSSGTVFLHEMTSPAGHHRLVAIDVNIGAGMFLSSTGHVEDVSLAATVIQPGRLLQRDQPLAVSQTSLWVCPADPKPTRFFAGSVDPNNPDHFTIDYERLNVHSSIDGRLNDDDTVTLSPRRGSTSHAREPLMWEPDDDDSTPTK